VIAHRAPGHRVRGSVGNVSGFVAVFSPVDNEL